MHIVLKLFNLFLCHSFLYSINSNGHVRWVCTVVIVMLCSYYSFFLPCFCSFFLLFFLQIYTYITLLFGFNAWGYCYYVCGYVCVCKRVMSCSRGLDSYLKRGTNQQNYQPAIKIKTQSYTNFVIKLFTKKIFNIENRFLRWSFELESAKKATIYLVIPYIYHTYL